MDVGMFLDLAAGSFVGVIVGHGISFLIRRRPRPQPETCTDQSGFPLCKSLRNPYCSDGRCRYHCTRGCKCPEVSV